MKRLCLLLLIAAALPRLSVLRAEVLISEFMASNDSTLLDEDRDATDWIELYNGGAGPVDLEGWHLTDDPRWLTKWRFPAVTIDAGARLLVFASGKDRAVAGSELHTSFRLSASGEYLGLVAPDGVTVVHEFAPEFPEQRMDLSYGIGQDVDIVYLVPPNAPLRVLVPTSGALGTSWTGGAEPFDDAGWRSGSSGAGYVTLIPGFAVRNLASRTAVNDLATAEDVIASPDLQMGVAAETAPTINYLGTGDGAYYPNDRPFPGTIAGSDNEDFVIEATGIVTFPLAGAWTFGVRSDDGFGLEITDGGATTFRIEYPAPRGPADTLGVFNVPAAGDYDLRLVMYERGGGSSVELFALRGSAGSWSASFRLVGDTAGGGLAVRSRPAPGSQGGAGDYRAAIRTDLEDVMSGVSASAYVRIPLSVADPRAFDSLFLRMKYDDGFAAYLNGFEVARRNAPGVLVANSAATADRPPEQAAAFEEINISSSLGRLRPGANVLAIQALNDGPDSPDFLIYAELAQITVLSGVPNYFDVPTPGAPNSTGFLDIVGDTVFSVDRGFFEAPFDLEIATETEGAEIRYTLNGTRPTPTSGLVYQGPIHIDRTTVVRAAAFMPDYLSTNVDTHTYIFLDDVIAQDYQATLAAGFPSSWGGTVPDYGMDRRVIGQNGTDSYSGKYAATIREDLKDIPTLSIAVNIDDLFGPGGIYTNSGNRGVAWERPCSVELFYPEGNAGFQEDCGIRIQGGAFRSHGLTKKHSLRLFFKGIYGATKLRYPIFGPGAPDRFDTLILRANANDGWQWDAAGSHPLYIRDPFARETVLDWGGVASHGIFVHLYINGIYWGVYNPVERPDDSFSATYFGGDKDNWDALNHDGATSGTMAAWNAMAGLAAQGLTANADYLEIQGRNPDGTLNPDLPNYLDVENYADYMIMNLYLGNTDWPHRNWYAGRDRVDDTGFKFYMWDAEWSMGINSGLQTNQVNVSGGVATPWPNVKQNAEFRLLVGDRLHRHCFDGGALYVDSANPTWDPQNPERNQPAARFVRLANTVEHALVAESARWGDQHAATPYTRDEHWRVERDSILAAYLPYRTSVVVQQFRAAGLYPNLDAPSFTKHGGQIQPGFVLFITAPDGTTYYTLDGSDPRLFGGAVSPSAREAGSATTVVLVPETARGRALVPVGDLGTAWTAIDFDDQAWREGPMGVGYERGSGYEALIGAGMDVGADMYNKNGSVYIRLAFTLDQEPAFSLVKLLMKYDDGFIAYLNGSKIAARNAPTTAAWNSLATGPHSDAEAVIFESILIPEAAPLLRRGRNVLAIHGLNQPVGSTDMIIVPRLEAGGSTQVDGIVLTETTLVRTRAYSGGVWSALAEALFVVPQPIDALRVTEIMYHPRENGPIDGDAYEFIELKNTGDEPIDLTAVRFTSGIDFTFPEGAVIMPGAFVVLVADLDAFGDRYPGVGAAGLYRASLSNSGDLVALADPQGRQLVSIPFDDAPPWPVDADGFGLSLVPVDPSGGGDPAKPSSWRASTLLDGSPGEDDPSVGPGAGWQIQGDLNQDRRLDISDPVAYLRYLFGRGPFALPCSGASAQEGANLALLDVNGSGGVNLADVVYLLSYLFQIGAPPARGTSCIVIEGCPSTCR